MRAFLTATALVFLAFTAASGQAEVSKAVTIAAQPLGPALEALAKDKDLQILYRSDLVGNLVTEGVQGEFTADEALKRLLKGTGLTYRYLGEKAVTIVRATAGVVEGNEAAGDGAMRFAQGQGATPDSGAGKSASGEKLEEVVVTAQRREERLQNVPISISVLTGADLDKSALSVDEMLNTVPGVQVLSTGEFGMTSVTIRGVGTDVISNGASPVAYYVDSVPFGLIKSGLAPDMSAYDLNRVEVLRGPQGTLYGASALNGVVRVLTNDADFSRYDFKVRASDSRTDGGGNNYRGDAVVNVPIVEGRLAARAVVGYQHDSGWVDAPNKDNVNDERTANYRLKVNARPTDELSIDLTAWRSRINLGAPGLSDENQRISTPEAEPVRTDFDMYGAKVGYRFPHLSITSSTSYLGYKNEGLLDISQQLLGPDSLGGAFLPLLTRDRADIFSEEVNLTSAGFNVWRWSAGGIYRRGTEKLRQAFDPSGSILDIRINDLSKSYAVFGEVTRVLFDGRWDLTAGLRHFHDDISQESRGDSNSPFLPDGSTASATTPRAVLTWHPTKDHLVYGSYSEGFRSGFPQNSYAVPAGFPPLQPDKLKNYELGAKGDWLDGRISYDTAVYYMDWRDTQQTLGVPFHGTYATALVNSESASGIGVDLSVVIRPIRNVTLGVSGSWNGLATDADLLTGGIPLFRKGDRLNFSPETTIGAWGNYAFAVGTGGYKARVAASANYVSPLDYRYLYPDATHVLAQPGDRMLLTQASVAIDSPHGWTLSLFGDNLTNEQSAPLFIPWPDFSQRARPRTVGLQVTYDFGHQ